MFPQKGDLVLLQSREQLSSCLSTPEVVEVSGQYLHGWGQGLSLQRAGKGWWQMLWERILSPQVKQRKEGTGQQDSLGVTGSHEPLPFRKTKTQKVLWFDCETSPTGSCVLILGAYLVALFWEMMMSLMGGAQRKEIMGQIKIRIT